MPLNRAKEHTDSDVTRKEWWLRLIGFVLIVICSILLVIKTTFQKLPLIFQWIINIVLFAGFLYIFLWIGLAVAGRIYGI